MRRRLHLISIGMAFFAAGSVQAAVMPEGRAIVPNKKVELKRKSGGFDRIAEGYVTRAWSQEVAIFGHGLDVSIGIQGASSCYVNFRVVTGGAYFKFHGNDLACYNFWNDDESQNNNNYQGLTITGFVWDEVNSVSVPAQLTLWPKREDRIRVVIGSSAAGGFREWEIDVDEGS